MLENLLPAHLLKRIEDLQGREISYIEDELFSEEALTNLAYRQELERIFTLDPLATVPFSPIKDIAIKHFLAVD